MTCIFSISMADSVLLVKKGWQLIGSSTALDSMSKFSADKVEQVWHFDASTQKWLGYSPDEIIQKKINDQHIATLENLKNWHGFWIKSKKEWTLTFEDKAVDTTLEQNKTSDVIGLKKGWNLISLPVDTVLSADIFDGMTAWKYNVKSEWEMFDETQGSEAFPRLGHIKNSDGIWVKATEDKNISVMEEASKLHHFATREEMEASIKEMAKIDNRLICGIEPFMTGVSFVNAPEDGGAGANDASGTNLQEAGVDEADILKHNGKSVFYVTKKNGLRNTISIGSFEELSKEEDAKVLNQISLGNKRIDSFYLVQDRLVVLSSAMDILKNIIDVFDVSNIENVQKVAEYKIDGWLKNSRVIGDNLYLITSFQPQYDIEYPREYLTPSQECKEYVDGNADYAQIETSVLDKYADCYHINKEDGRYFRIDYDEPRISITDLLPEINGNELITPQRLYASAKQQQSTTITTISNFSIADARYLKSTSFIGERSIEYASSKSLYLVSNGYPHFYDFNNYKSRATLYKFNFDEDISYQAAGSVYGTALNQFSLSEYDDVLRIATTEGFSWGNTGTNNTLYTLKEKDGLLSIEGLLSGLGKEGETIKSVRFMGKRAYLVTFRTTDPLYSIDLSNPKEPIAMGKLEVNGYSAYLHPIGEDKLLGVGVDTNSEGRRLGVKIELFDISDFAHPSSLDSIVLEENSYSELENNHKALAYRASDNLFAFPYSKYNGNNYLGIFQVKGDALKSYEAVLSQSSNWGEHRGLIFDFNGTTYISFFSDENVLTKKLTD